jgi:hypothetical protein
VNDEVLFPRCSHTLLVKSFPPRGMSEDSLDESYSRDQALSFRAILATTADCIGYTNKMGNNTSFSIGVWTDGIIYATGSTVKGCVYLSVNSEEGVHASALKLVLSGVEMASTAKTTKTLRPGISMAGLLHTHSIVKKTMSIASFQNGWIAQGHYEFPFQFQVPLQLPSTMLCSDLPDRCEVQYDLEGHLVLSSGSANVTGESKKWIIKIAGGSPPPTAEPTVVVPTVQKGQISLSGEIMTNGDGIRPGDSINVAVKYSSNESHDARAARIKILLKEKVTWNNGHSTKKAILAEQHVEIKSGQDSSLHQVILEIPKMAHETYNGKHINVTHKLTLQLDHGILDLIQPHLKSTALISIMKCPRDQLTAVIAEFVRNEEPSVSPRDVLPENWNPQTVNMVGVPFAEAVEIV